MSNKWHNVFYTGVTNNIQRRAWEHKYDKSKFTKRYSCHHLLYYEEHRYILEAIKKEKQLKKWRHEWKVELIKKENPGMEDLAKDWFE